MRALIGVTSWFCIQVEQDLRRSGLLVTAVDDDEALLESLPMVGQAAIFLDMDSPGSNWTRLLDKVRRTKPNSAILGLTEAARLEDEIAALTKGADDVITPRMDAREIAGRAVRAAVRWAGHSSTILRIGALEIDTVAQKVAWAGTPVSLTRTQYHILEHLALRPGQHVPPDEILDLLYGVENAAEMQSIRVFVSYLRKRLQAAGADAVEITGVSNLGFRLKVEDETPALRHTA